MPYIPTETIVSAAILAALIAGWRYVQQNPQQQEAIPAAIKKTASAVLPGGKGLFEDELTGESASGSGKKSKVGSKKSASKKKKNGAAAVGDVSGKEDHASSSRVEPAPEAEAKAPVPVPSQSKVTKEKPKTLAEKKVKKAPKAEVDDMLPEDQKQPQIARVMKIVPEQSTSTSSAPTPAPAPAQEEPAAATQAANEDFGYEDEDAELDESEEDDGWEVPKKFVGSGNANGGSFAAIAGNSRAPSAPSLNRFSLLTSSNPNFPQSPSTRRTTSTQRSSSSAADNSAPTKVQRKNANKREAQKLQKEQEEKERLERLKSYRAEAAKERAGAGGKRDALGKPVENWGSQTPSNLAPYPPPLPITLDTVVNFLRSTLFYLPFALSVPMALKYGFRLAIPELRDTPRSKSILYWANIYSDLGIFIGVARVLGRCYNNQQKIFGKKEKVAWEDQIVVVTGGASGVGALLVRTLALLGATAVVLDINECGHENENVWSYVCDVSNYDAVIDVAQRIRDEVGNPTMLVNNAGVVSGKLILDLEARDVERTFGVNVLSHFWTIKAFLPSMLENGKGHIVTVASVLGLAGSAQMVDYCASKAALITMHDALRFELNNRYKAPQIRTTLLLPGHIRTPLFDKIQFPRSLFFRFMAPSLEPGQVVQKIVRALAAQESRVFRMPFYTHSARFLNLGSGLTPGWIRDFLQWLSQADFAMERYHAR